MRYWTNALTLTSGCTKVSPACLNCWAETNHNRFMRKANKKYDHDFSEVRVHKANIDKLYAKGKHKVFAVWNDAFMGMGIVPFEIQWKLFEAIEANPQHTVLICTKRPDNMADFIAQWLKKKSALDNCFLGITVENQEMANKRIPELLKCQSFKLFLSIEPMLEEIDLHLTEEYFVNRIFEIDRHPISYIIAGCESGKNARETRIEWFRDLKEQCIESDTPLWIKQVRIDGKMLYDYQPLSTITKEKLWIGTAPESTGCHNQASQGKRQAGHQDCPVRG